MEANVLYLILIVYTEKFSRMNTYCAAANTPGSVLEYS